MFESLTEKIPDNSLWLFVEAGTVQKIFNVGTSTHPSGDTGVSVESAEEISVAELASAIPHRQIGVTTAGCNPKSWW